MPSIPKTNPRTGSVLLGQELRRLRGTRSLREICDLTKSPSLSGHVAPISIATLCEIESGKSFPLLATLHALSVIYKTSMSQLMAFVTEEKLAGEVKEIEGASPEQLYQSLLHLMGQREWSKALVVCLVGERRAPDAAARLSWRANRAGCLAKLDLHDEAIALFAECCESPLLPPDQRYGAVVNLSMAHLSAGNLWQAGVFLQQAEILSESVSAGMAPEGRLSARRAETILWRHVHGQAVSERELREALRLLDRAIEQASGEAPNHLSTLKLERALAYSALGNHLLAERDANEQLRVAERSSSAELLGYAHHVVALVAVASGDVERAIAHFTASVSPCEEARQYQRAFESCFRLFLLLRDVRPGRATQFLRRCDELAPLVSTRTPLWSVYASVQRSRA